MGISDDLRKVEASIDGALHDPAKLARQTGNGIADMTEALLGDAEANIGQFAKMAQSEGTKAVNTFRRSAQERPTLTVGLAAGAGIILGLLLAARR